MSDNKWPTLATAETNGEGSICATARIGMDASWFDGHFPDEPVLPGIAQLAMVFDAVRRSASGELEIRGFRRVRFRQVIRPDDNLEIIVAPHEKQTDAHVFEIRIHGEPACRGTMMAGPANRDGDPGRGRATRIG